MHQQDFHGIIEALRLGKTPKIIKSRRLFSCPGTNLWQGCLKPPPPSAGTKPSPHIQTLGTATLPCLPAQLPLPGSSAMWAQFLKQKAAGAAQCYPLQRPAALTWRLAANHTDRSHCLFSSILVFLVLWKIRAGRQAIHQPINAVESFGFVLNNCAFYCYLHIYFLRQ